MIEVKSKDFAKLQREVGRLDKEVQKALKIRLKKAMQPVILEVKAAALALPSNRGESVIRNSKGSRPGLRLSLSRSVVGQLKTSGKTSGANIMVRKAKFLAISQRDNANLPWYVQGRPKRGWRHPVFGRNMDKPETWPIQKPTPFLDETIKKRKDHFATQVNESFGDALDKLDVHFK